MPGQSGPGLTDARQDLEFYAAAGTLTLPLYRGGDAITRARDVEVNGVYDSGEGVPTRDRVQRVSSLARGAGFSRRPVGLDEGSSWDGYGEGSNVCTRFGYICPAGEQTTVTATAAWGQIRKILEFNGDLWFVFKNRLAYLLAGTATSLTDYYTAPGTDEFTDAEIWAGSLRVATFCVHSNPNQHFFVTVTPSGGSGSYAAALNPTPASPGGTGATAATPPARLMVTVFWNYSGTGRFRLAAQVSDTTYRYMTVPSGDPYADANWGPAIEVGESSYEIRQLVSSHDTMWAVKQDGVYAITDANAAAGGENLTPYWKDQIDADATSAVGYYWGQYLVVARPFGIETIDVNSWQVQDAPRPIGISHGRPNDTTINGRTTALGSDNGYLLAAYTNASGSGILYGLPRRRESPAAGLTEFDWFGPEFGPSSVGEITALCVHTPEATLQPGLWVALMDGSGNPYIRRVDLFRGSSPLADPNHRYSTNANLTYTDEHWGARSATKGSIRATLAVRNCGDNRRADLYVAAGAGATFGADPAMSADTDVETKTARIVGVRGSTIRTRVNLISSATVPVVVYERELKANLGFPLRKRGTWLVEVSDVRSGDDLPSGDDPDDTEAALVALCESVEEFEALCDDGTTRTIVLDNILPWRKAERNDAERKTLVLEVAYQVVAVEAAS